MSGPEGATVAVDAGAAPGPSGAVAAAFFDLDRTLMAGSSSFEFGRVAYRAGLVSRRRITSAGMANLRFRLRGSTDADTAELRRRVSETIAGIPERELKRLAPAVLAGILPRVYPQMLDVAYKHQDAGRQVYICTAASQELAKLLAIVLSFDGALGSASEVVDGVYTGREGGPFAYREGKAQVIRELADRQGIDLAASYAYSDSESDLPMLDLVGNPIAVNPDRPLAAHAAEHGWEVLRFDTLGRRLKLAGATAMALMAVGAGGAVAQRRYGLAR